MNGRKPVDYTTMFAALDTLMASALPQMELYFAIGQEVYLSLEKGAAVAAAEYLCCTYPDASGFSPRNLRRMREFYRTYEHTPKVLAEAMTIGWTQNVVLLEAELDLQERAWYIQAVKKFRWSKLELQRKITANAHLEIVLDLTGEMCYIEEKDSMERTANDKNALHLLLQYLPQPDGRVYHDRPDTESQCGEAIPRRICSHEQLGNWQFGISFSPPQAGQARNSLLRENGPAADQSRLWPLRPPGWDGQRQSAKHASHLRRSSKRQAPPADGVHRLSWRCGRLIYGGLRCHLAGCAGRPLGIVGLLDCWEYMLISAGEREGISSNISYDKSA